MKIILKIFVPILLILLLAEGGLHLVEAISPKVAPGNESGKGFKAEALEMFLQEKINKIWMRQPEARKTILEPPFQVFVNKNFQDKERMDFIFSHAALPAKMNETAENFLRLNKSEKNYTFHVTTNSLSFRDPERHIKKDKNTFRVIVLGSYPAFGHAVNDHETYAQILEKDLNDKFGQKLKVEVWNGGRQGGTSIMGYARLVNEVSHYSPDLIIWDYGWIELYLTRDRVRRNGTFEFMKEFNFFERNLFPVCLKTFLSNLKLCKVSMQKITKISYTDAIEGWRESMRLVKKWSIQNKVPVAFLRHNGVTIPAKEYEAFNSPAENFHYVDTSPALADVPTEEEISEFWSGENWITELNFDKTKVMSDEPRLVFFGDAIQYNKHAYKRIGLFLSDHIQTKFIPKKVETK